jgi:hypothetical protein
MDDYFNELAKRLVKACPEEDRRRLPTELWGAHHRHIAGKTGLFDLISPETASWMKPVSDSFQKEWLEKHPEQTARDIRDSKQGGSIQDLSEAVSRYTREHYAELFSQTKEYKG